MNTYKNVQIALEYNVSSTAVLRWIEGSIKGKNSLQLHQVKNKLKILESEHNKAELLRLSKQSVIYKNKILYSEVSPKPYFYEVFKPEQIIEIINYMETKRVIPHKFDYIAEGANIWSNFIHNSMDIGSYTQPDKESSSLLELYPYLEAETSKYNKVNIIDIGCGNSYPLIETIKQFHNISRLNKYVAVDISKAMLQLAKENMAKVAPQIKSETAECDIENENPAKIFFKDRSNKDGVVGNIIFFVGVTYGNIENRAKALGNLRAGMGKDDYLVFTNRLDRPKNRTVFKHTLPPSELWGLVTWIPRLLNINVNGCVTLGRYNDIEQKRQTAIKLDKDYSIDFEVLDTTRRVNLYKGEELVVWSHHLSTVSEIIRDIESAGFKMQLLSVHEDSSTVTIICKTNDIVSYQQDD